MARSTQLADLFRCPALVAQRNYEICKAYYLDGATAEQLAERFDLHPDSVRAVVRDFAHDPDLDRGGTPPPNAMRCWRKSSGSASKG